MGFDESLFGFVFRAFRSVQKRRNDPALSPSAASLVDAAKALSVLASAVAERRLEVVEAEGAGAVRAPRLFLPAVLDLHTTREISQQAYLVRTVLDASVVLVGPRLREAPGSSSAELLAALLVLPRALKNMREELPSAYALYETLCPVVRALRVQELDGRKGHAPLEALVQLRLGLSLEDACTRLSHESARAWLSRAANAHVTTSEELQEALAELTKISLPGNTVAPPLFGALALGSVAPVHVGGDVPSRAPEKNASEKVMRAREQIKHVDLGEDKLDENPIVHSFEKLHTADNYRGGKKRADGQDELSEHGEALDELDLHEVTRSGENARSVFRADLLFDIDTDSPSGANEPAERGIPYDEWDERKQRYRTDWCQVFIEPLQGEMSFELAQQTIRDMVHKRRREILALESDLIRLRSARAWHKRQPDGPDIDTDAVVDRYAALRSGSTPSDRLYEMRRKHRPDLTVMVLTDASASTESWVLGQRVLDVAREALVVLGEAVAEQDIRLGMAAFSSNTRRHCSFAWLKGFDEPWDTSRLRIARLEPRGYTRIGPALRHATMELSLRPETKKLLILLSDGKATDYDQYEGRHGMGDVRKAVAEAEARGVHVLALAIDRTGRAHLPAMFGRGRFEVLSKPELLPRALGETCANLLRA